MEGADGLWNRAGQIEILLRFSSSFGARKKRIANLPLMILSGSPVELCIFKVSHESQMHIAA